jgi:hypothetical protein
VSADFSTRIFWQACDALHLSAGIKDELAALAEEARIAIDPLAVPGSCGTQSPDARAAWDPWLL